MTQTRSLFNAGKLAVLSNVGVLLRPTTKTDYNAKTQLPPQLFFALRHAGPLGNGLSAGAGQ
jgi:hypothetical protein